MLKKEVRERYLVGYGLLAPAFIATILFFVVPLILGFITSLKGGFAGQGGFVGFKNFRYILTDPRFWHSLQVSVVFTALFILISAGGGFLCSLAWVNKSRGYRFYMSAAFIPYISTPIIGALVWKNMLGDPYGFTNALLVNIGLESIPWFKNPSLALMALILIQAWYTLGYNAILFFSGLQAIPESYLEAAEMEGCGFVQKTIKILLPLLIPTIVFVVTVSILYGFINSYVLASLITDNGPFEATNVMMSYIFEYAFGRFELGKANAATFLVFILFLVIAYIQFNYQNKRFQGLD